jgi:hypothetical protein
MWSNSSSNLVCSGSVMKMDFHSVKSLKKRKRNNFTTTTNLYMDFFFFQLLTFNFILFIQGVRVQVRSVYIEGRSQPSKGLYFFAYRIRITNNSDDTVQLLRRHWIITDANGRTENVRWVSHSLLFYCVMLPRCFPFPF